jgi:hypothetical protein
VLDNLFDEPTVSESYRRWGERYDEDINNYEDDINYNVPKLPSIHIHNIKIINNAINETINKNNKLNDNINSSILKIENGGNTQST